MSSNEGFWYFTKALVLWTIFIFLISRWHQIITVSPTGYLSLMGVGAGFPPSPQPAPYINKIMYRVSDREKVLECTNIIYYCTSNTQSDIYYVSVYLAKWKNTLFWIVLRSLIWNLMQLQQIYRGLFHIIQCIF